MRVKRFIKTFYTDIITDDLILNNKLNILHGEGQTTAGKDPGNEGRRNHGEVLSDVLHAALIDLGLRNPLRLCSPVLEPDLDLGLSQLQFCSELRSLRYGQVALFVELLLQFVELLVSEGSSGLPVGLVLPQGALERELLMAGILRGTGGGALELGHVLLLLELLQEEQLGHWRREERRLHHQGQGLEGGECWRRDRVGAVADGADTA